MRPIAAGAALLAASGAWAATYPQPYIASFAPTSGTAGTVVTLTGSGFTGLNQAWVGNAHDGTLQVVSDSKVTVTVPKDATTGAIGILNPANASFTPSSFTVSSGSTGTTYPQPYISGYTPTSGPAGTVVTLNGSGFTGTNAAWVGAAHDGTVKVVSDTQLQVTVPADASTGSIGIFNPLHVSFAPTTFTVTAATASYPQQTISGFSPASGSAGATITLTGTGFTGSTQAWVGNGHDAALKVVSDTQATVTVPADASTGAVTIVNPLHSAASATAFTVTAAAPTYPQQVISGLSPASGPAGTVVTLTGSGFTGTNAAWVGAAHDGTVKVVSDTQATVTVPADGSSGPIELLNPQHTAVSASAFTVTGSAVATPTTSGLSIHVQGSKFVDGSGRVVQLRGVNFSGFEFVAIGGWDPADPSGAQGGQANGPKWSAIVGWHANVVRIPLNEASWLGYSCTDTSGVVHNPDPGANYKSAVATQVAQANAAGLYVILDLHWAAPGTACPMLQSQMADADHSLSFWTSIANQFKNNPAVMFELFNEPFMNFDFSGNAWSYMMFGTNGAFSGYPATSSTGNWQDVKKPWAIASYQQMLNAVRATGATNVVLIGAMQYTQDLSGWLAYRPVDPQGQIAATWHPYPTFGTTWGTYAYSQPNYAPGVFTDVKNILAAGFPVIATETGDRNTPGTVGAPLVATITTFADQTGIGLVGWTWDVWGDPANVLIKDVNGTPTDGYGQFYQSWMVNHAP